jgi:hypothetical protein
MEASNLHDLAAAQRLPGPACLEVLGWMHETLRPRVYVEIGVDWGESLRLARRPTIAVGIDPELRTERCRFDALTYLFSMTSAAFFRAHSSFAAGFGLAFVDGLHLFEAALEDFLALERHAGPETVIALHDTIPLDAETSARSRTTDFYTGDVWRMLPWLAENRPDLEVATVRTAPSGLTLIRRGQPRAHEWIANRRDAVTSWLLGARTPLSSR